MGSIRSDAPLSVVTAFDTTNRSFHAPAPLRRAKFSVQIRDLVDLVVTRLSDLNGQSKARRRKGTASDHDRSPGMGVPVDRASSHLGGDYGDPTTKEVRHLACSQCQSFPTSFVLDCSSIGTR